MSSEGMEATEEELPTELGSGDGGRQDDMHAA
jgi:hypothetical protein